MKKVSKKRKSMSMSSKLALLIVSILLVFGLVTASLSHYIVKNSNLADMNESLHDKGLILSQTIKKDTLQSILDNPSADNKDVVDMTEEMDAINDNSASITNLYLITKDGESVHAPVLSSSILKMGAEYNQDMIAMGLSKDFINTINEAFEKGKVTATEVYGDEFGEYKTGLAPIYDENGSIAALYAIDYDVSKVTKKAWSETRSIIIVTLIFLILGTTAVYYLIRKKLAPVQTLSHHSRKVAEGDLTVEKLNVSSNDEIGELAQNFNLMVDNLKNIIESVSKVSGHVANASHVLSANMQEVANTNNQVVASMQEVAGGADAQAEKANNSTRIIEEMSIGIQTVAVSAAQISESSTTATEEAEKGNDSTRKSVDQIRSISEVVNESASRVKLLGERSEKIEEIVDLITGIASQTNLLALNAAIEAARAGEAGSGFAVVAEEVRKLAEQSEGSARQIADLISQIQKDTVESVKLMDNAVEEVNSGLQIVSESERSFGSILSSIHQVAEEIQELSATFEEMAAGTEEVTDSVKQMETISISSRDNTKAVAEVSVSQLDTIHQASDEAQLLRELSDELQETVNKFKIH